MSQKNAGDEEVPNESIDATADPFDPSALRLSQDFGADLGVKRLILTIPVRKPDRQWFVRTHPSEDYRLATAVLEVKEDRETYLVSPALRSELPGEIVPKLLWTAINRQGVVFLWAIRLPGTEGKVDAWNRSASDAAERAQYRWTRVSANMALGAYDVFEGSNDLPEPIWPEISFKEILRIAFKDNYIETPDHPVLRRLRGLS